MSRGRQVTIAVTHEQWVDLKDKLSLGVETAAILHAGFSDADDFSLLVRDIHWIPDEHYTRRERSALEITSAGFVPSLKKAADDGTMPIFFHTHPQSSPSPSRYDAEVDNRLKDPFRIRTGHRAYASLVLGGTADVPTFDGRLLVDQEDHRISRIRVVGDRLQLLTQETGTVDRTIYDRQVRAFGRDGQQLLSQLRVGVVGMGGTGSAVFELLVRLGVGRLIIADDDLVTESNLTRVHESSKTSVGLSKTQVAQSAADRIGLGTSVQGFNSRITDQKTAMALRDCDVVFGCTDDNRGRAILARLAYWYLVPIIDTAFLVDTDSGRVRGLYGRVTIVQPGTPCLFCRDRIDIAALGAEGLPVEERDRLAAEGYVPGIGEPDPSVGTYTTLTASFAVSEMLNRLYGLADATPSELLLRLSDHAISRLSVEPREDHFCQDRGTWGRGDTEPFLGQVWT